MALHVGDLRLAYLDPGAGSLVLQGLIAFAAGALVTLRLYWKRILAFFGRGGDEAEPPTQHSEEDAPGRDD